MNMTKKTMTSMQLQSHSAAALRADWRNPWAMLVSLADAVDTRTLHTAGADTTDEVVATLLERADQYEATQPSYAADLRAAAQAHGAAAAI